MQKKGADQAVANLIGPERQGVAPGLSVPLARPGSSPILGAEQPGDKTLRNCHTILVYFLVLENLKGTDSEEVNA